MRERERVGEREGERDREREGERGGGWKERDGYHTRIIDSSRSMRYTLHAKIFILSTRVNLNKIM